MSAAGKIGIGYIVRAVKARFILRVYSSDMKIVHLKFFERALNAQTLREHLHARGVLKKKAFEFTRLCLIVSTEGGSDLTGAHQSLQSTSGDAHEAR